LIRAVRQAIPAKNGVASFDGGFFPKPAAMVSKSRRKVQFSLLRINRSPEISLSSSATTALAVSVTSTNPLIPSVYQGNSLYALRKSVQLELFQSPKPRIVLGLTTTAGSPSPI